MDLTGSDSLREVLGLAYRAHRLIIDEVDRLVRSDHVLGHALYAVVCESLHLFARRVQDESLTREEPEYASELYRARTAMATCLADMLFKAYVDYRNDQLAKRAAS